MKIYKVCFWLNTKSNHQNAFLEALAQDKTIDFQVRYISQPSQNRLEIGWDNTHLKSFEKYVLTFDTAMKSLNDYQERIHIISGNKVTFSGQLIDLFIKEKIKWIHWSERYGLVLASKLQFNVTLFNLIRPFYLLTKKSYGHLVQNYALGAFSQGFLAEKDFKFIGINKFKITDLYYTTEIGVQENDNYKVTTDIIRFLYVGELSKRKGIEELLKACSRLTNNNWTLTLVGADKTNGYYNQLSRKLNLENKVNFKGVVPNNKVSEYYKNCDVFVFPSKFDGWGAVLNEAVAYSLPIISTDETGSSFTLIRDNGFVIKAGDISELSHKMQNYIDNKSLILEHSKNSKKLSEICTPRANVERFVNALNNWTKGTVSA